MKVKKSFRVDPDVEEKLARLSESNGITQTAIVQLLVRSCPEELKVLLKIEEPRA